MSSSRRELYTWSHDFSDWQTSGCSVQDHMFAPILTRDIIQTNVPTGLPHAGPIVYEWSSYKITYGLY